MGTHLYVCGPPRMIEGVSAAAEAAHWPISRVHHEAFQLEAIETGPRFVIAAVRSNQVIEVPEEIPTLQALENAGLPVRSMCRRGFCGECVVSVLEGQPLHRDQVLDLDDRAAGERMIPCVSRAEGVLKLDL